MMDNELLLSVQSMEDEIFLNFTKPLTFLRIIFIKCFLWILHKVKQSFFCRFEMKYYEDPMAQSYFFHFEYYKIYVRNILKNILQTPSKNSSKLISQTYIRNEILNFMFKEQAQTPITKKKTIHFIQNGHPQILFTETFSKPLSLATIQNVCDQRWNAKSKTIRLFSIEGVEIMEQDLAYVRNNDRIYISKGEEFDNERNFGEYELLKQLGEGGFGKVWLAKSNITQEKAAIKILKLQKITGARDIDMVFREVQTLRALNHPNIVKILNCYTLTNMQLIVVMEYLAGGQLLGLLKQKGRFRQTVARQIFIQIVAAVHHCHSQSIIHRDLKLQNVLLVNKEENRVKVADFGISGVADALNPDIDIGTLRYMAPEVLSHKQKNNTAAVDVWACGIMLYCMVYGKLPFAEHTTAATTHAIINGNYSFPKHILISPECRDLISLLLKADPKQRPSMNEVQGHPWIMGNFKEVRYDQILQTLSQTRQQGQKELKKVPQSRNILPKIPKRLQKQKQQVIEQLKYLKASRGRLLKSDSKWKAGQSPRFMQNIKCRQNEEKDNIKRKRSLFSNVLWK